MAACLNADENFSVFRKFGTLRTRVMLHRQWELETLEKELDDLDKEDEKNDAGRIQSIAYDHARSAGLPNQQEPKKQESPREKIIKKIEKKLEQYGG